MARRRGAGDWKGTDQGDGAMTINRRVDPHAAADKAGPVGGLTARLVVADGTSEEKMWANSEPAWVLRSMVSAMGPFLRVAALVSILFAYGEAPHGGARYPDVLRNRGRARPRSFLGGPRLIP